MCCTVWTIAFGRFGAGPKIVSQSLRLPPCPPPPAPPCPPPRPLLRPLPRQTPRPPPSGLDCDDNGNSDVGGSLLRASGLGCDDGDGDGDGPLPRPSGLGCDDGDDDGDGPLPRPSSSVPSGLSSRGGTRETPSEASYYQAAPTKEPPLQLPRASPSQKLPEAPWPTNPQPPTLISAPLKPQSHPINSTSSQLERSTEGSIHSTNGVSLHVNATSQQQGRGLSSSSTQRPENLSSQPPQANNGKSKVGKNFSILK